MNINIFTGSWNYEHKNKQRENEFLFCYEKNKALNFNHYHIDDERASYNKLFLEAKKYSDDINIITNSDIFFTKEFLNKLYDIFSKNEEKENLCLALTRWNYVSEDNIVFQNSNQSQDSFIVYGGLDLSNHDEILLGVPGCDNKLVAILKHDLKMNVYNPSIDLISYHYHPSGDQTRTYLNEKGERIKFVEGRFEFIAPCSINDIK